MDKAGQFKLSLKVGANKIDFGNYEFPSIAQNMPQMHHILFICCLLSKPPNV